MTKQFLACPRKIENKFPFLVSTRRALFWFFYKYNLWKKWLISNWCYFLMTFLNKQVYCSGCRLRRAIALARHRSRKINLRRAINRSPAHEKSLASSKNKNMFHLRFIFSELKNFSYKAALSRTSNNKHDRVCHICSRYHMAFVYLRSKESLNFGRG